MNYQKDLLLRIKDRTSKSNNCWTWTGSFSVSNIPVIKYKQKTFYPRRVLFEIENSLTLTENLKSVCENKSCVKPSHHQLKSSKFKIEITESDILRFKNKTITSNSDCILWTGSKTPSGYGKFRINYKIQAAHRVSYCINLGVSLEYIKNKVIMHSCDNPSCVNPDHLKAGTQKDNMKDCVSKKRHSYPSVKNKLNQELINKVKQYRLKGLSIKEISDKLNLKYSTASYIVYKK